MMPMWKDPIVEQIRSAREELFARFNHDLTALCEYLRSKEREHSDRVVRLASRRPEVRRSDTRHGLDR